MQILRVFFSALLLIVLTAGSGTAAGLPTPGDIPAGPAVVQAPGGTGLPELGGAVPAGAPVISAVSETTFAGETLVITGDSLKDARLRVWAEGRLFDIVPLRSDEQKMQAVVPTAADGKPLAGSTMLVWPVKGDRVGSPIRVNGPALWWAWPSSMEVEASEPLRLFGKNLVMEGTQPHAYFAGEDGKVAEMKLLKTGPYELQAALPAGLPAGTYRAWVHNGTGGRWGWSEATQFKVINPAEDPKTVISVKGGRGINMADVLRQAVTEAVAKGGAVIKLPAGRFEVNGPIVVPQGTQVVFRGEGMGDWDKTGSNFNIGGKATVIYDHRGQSGKTSFLELFGNGSRVEDMTVLMRSIKGERALLLAGQDQSVRRVRFICQAPNVYNASLVESRCDGTANHVIDGCEFVLMSTAIFVNQTNYVRISNSAFYGMYMVGRGVEANAIRWGSSFNGIVESSYFRGLDRTRGRVLGRTILFGPQNIRNVFVSGNRSEWVGSHASVPAMEGNVSEQYLFHVGAIDGGVFPVLSSGANRLKVQADRKKLPADFAAGEQWMAFIARGKGAGQWRIIAGEDKDGSLLLQKSWRVLPDATSVAVVQRVVRQVAICDNYINPAPDPSIIDTGHKTVGVYWYHLCFDNITAGNTMKNIGTGVAFAVESDSPCAWNTIRNNSFENVTGTAGGTSYKPMFFNEHHRGVRLGETRQWVSVGNVFRANKGKGADVAGLIGWLRYDIKDEAYKPDADSGLMMTVVENNELLDAGQGFLLTSPANWTLLRNNRITVTGATPPVERLKPERIIEAMVVD